MIETQATFAEFPIRSVKNILNRYKEDYGRKYIHKLRQFATSLISRTKGWIDLKTKHMKIPLFCPIYTANFYESTENQN